MAERNWANTSSQITRVDYLTTTNNVELGHD